MADLSRSLNGPMGADYTLRSAEAECIENIGYLWLTRPGTIYTLMAACVCRKKQFFRKTLIAAAKPGYRDERLQSRRSSIPRYDSGMTLCSVSRRPVFSSISATILPQQVINQKAIDCGAHVMEQRPDGARPLTRLLSDARHMYQPSPCDETLGRCTTPSMPT